MSCPRSPPSSGSGMVKGVRGGHGAELGWDIAVSKRRACCDRAWGRLGNLIFLVPGLRGEKPRAAATCGHVAVPETVLDQPALVAWPVPSHLGLAKRLRCQEVPAPCRLQPRLAAAFAGGGGMFALCLFIGGQVAAWLHTGLHGAHGIPAWHGAEEPHGEL